MCACTFALPPAFAVDVGEHFVANDRIPNHLHFVRRYDGFFALSQNVGEGRHRDLVPAGHERGLFDERGVILCRVTESLEQKQRQKKRKVKFYFFRIWGISVHGEYTEYDTILQFRCGVEK